MLRLELDRRDPTYAPGEAIHATCVWELSRPNEELELCLYWRTEGKGTVESDLVIKKTWKVSTSSGSTQIKIPIPRGPLSFLGKLIRIQWYLSLSASDSREDLEEMIVVSHTGSALRLSEAII